MKQIHSNNQGFSIVVAVFMIGFLLVLTTWVFNLVLREMKDNRWAENYLKAYAGAEWAMELWLLNIKKDWYATDTDLELTDSGSKSLTFSWSFKQQSDPLISYQTDIAVSSNTGSLQSGETVIIPLFVNGVGIKHPQLTAGADIIWNIIGNWEWMSGSGSFDENTSQVYKQEDNTYSSSETIQNFLSKPWNNTSYLMLFNKNWTNSEDYSLVDSAGAKFSKPVWNITSSVTVGRYKQNISTSIDNTEFLKMLKYSVFSK